MSGVRAFVAIELAEPVRRLLAEASRAVVAASPSWRDEKWVRADNLHITLKFLGNVDQAVLESIGESLSAVTASHASFDLRAAGLHAVPGLRRCKMVWASFDDAPGACEGLAADVDIAVAAFGFEPESRAFKPHATLCRTRRPKALAAEALAAGTSLVRAYEPSVSVASISLIASELTRNGPVYTVVDTYRLEE